MYKRLQAQESLYLHLKNILPVKRESDLGSLTKGHVKGKKENIISKKINSKAFVAVPHIYFRKLAAALKRPQTINSRNF